MSYNIYSAIKDLPPEDYDDSRATLNTPDIMIADSTSSFDDHPEPSNAGSTSESFSTEPLKSSAVDYPTPSKDHSEIAFDSSEWQINDLISGRKRAPRQNEFLQLLLKDPRYSSHVCWVNQKEGFFKILQPDQVAALWEKVKGRQTNRKMDYETFARGIRYYYKKGIMIKTNKKYTFCFKQSTQ